MYRESRRNRSIEFKATIHAYNKTIQTMILQFKTHSWLLACDEILKAKGKNYWQIFKKLNRYNQARNWTANVTCNGCTLTTSSEKATAFAEQFAKTYSLATEPNFDDENFRNVINWYENFFNGSHSQDEPIDLITNWEFTQVLKNCKNTSPGIDKAPILIIKKLDQRVHYFIINAINVCLSHAHFPRLWKNGIVITIPKPSQDHSLVSNYRSITLLPTIGKLFERTIKCRLEKAIRNHIPKYRFGFKNGISTLNALTILTSNVESHKLSNKNPPRYF